MYFNVFARTPIMSVIIRELFFSLSNLKIVQFGGLTLFKFIKLLIKF